jgi:hypothetical protein
MTNLLDVTAVIPTIPPRRELCWRAVESVNIQTWTVKETLLQLDRNHEGAWATRNRAIDRVNTKWIAFLDDDDEWLPWHVEYLSRGAAETDADYVFSWFSEAYIVGRDPLGNFGVPFNNANPHHTGPMSGVMVKTELAQRVRFTQPDEADVVGGEDWRFTLDCVAQGAKIVHLPAVTYNWHWDRIPSTHGLPFRWA